MVRAKPTLPTGHGEVVEQPEYAQWPALVSANRVAAAAWTFDVAGIDAQTHRAGVRAEVLTVARDFSARLGIELPQLDDGTDVPVVATGHQPDLYHPGVWVKDFLLDRLARQVGAIGVDVVVDTDGFDSVAVTAPCMAPGVKRCKQYLALGTKGSSFSQTPVPSAHDVSEFCATTQEMLSSLPAPAVGRHFSEFCTHLSTAAADANNVAELVTVSRRRYEAAAGTEYLEAPLTAIARTAGFARFVVDIAANAQRFSDAYNTELARYRELSKVRSAAQPFPDLAYEEGRYELPLWQLSDAGRSTVWVQPGGNGRVALTAADGEVLCELPAQTDEAVRALMQVGVTVAPKALALTLFVRMFACDLFIHGIGGGRYDRVTDGVIRAYYGVEPPAFVVASMTMYLPLGAHAVSAQEVSAAKERLNRLEHNPDVLLDEVEFDSPAERDGAVRLAAEKGELVAKISLPDADRKALGLRIKQVNAELAQVLAPMKLMLERDLARLESQHAASEVLTDRTYPFCFWDPQEIADKVR